MRRLLLAVLLGLISAFTCGCLPFPEVDDVAYVVSITADKSDINRLKVGVKIPVPRLVGKVQGGAIGTGGGPGQELYMSTRADAATILEGLTTIQLYLARQISLEHARILLISDQIARDGIEEIITPLLRLPQTRSTLYIVIVRGDAWRLSKANQPQLEANIARYVNLQTRSVDLNGLSKVTPMGEFYNCLRSLGCDAVTGIWALNEEVMASQAAEEREMAGGPSAPDEGDAQDIAYKQAQRYGQTEGGKQPEPPTRTTGSYLPGELPRESGNAVEWNGLAVFRKDKMVGELNGNESIAYRLLSGNLFRATVTVTEIDNPDNVLTAEIAQARAPHVEVTSAGKQVNIKVVLHVEANLLSTVSPGNTDVMVEMAEYEDAIANTLHAWIDAALRKTQEWGADIFSFGEHYRRNFATWQEWEKFNWTDHFKTAKTDVEIKVNIRRPGLIVQPMKQK